MAHHVGTGGSDVVLHLYDLSMGMARAMSMAFIGKQIDCIPHTGIVVYGHEYFYGGGIQVCTASRYYCAANLQLARILLPIPTCICCKGTTTVSSETVNLVACAGTAPASSCRVLWDVAGGKNSHGPHN
jgi:hypothetical protein